MSATPSTEAVVDHHAEYFENYLPTLIGKRLVEGLEGLDCCFEIVITSAEDIGWQLVIEDGCLAHVGRQGGMPACRFRVGEDAFRDVMAGDVTPADAFLDLQVEIEGDMETGLRLSMVLEPFFQRYPYRF